MKKYRFTLITATTVISVRPAGFGGLIIGTDGTNNAVINVYNQHSTTLVASNKVIPQVTITGADNTGQLDIVRSIYCPSGITVAPTGTGASCTVLWER